jgi:hypothetical protein
MVESWAWVPHSNDEKGDVGPEACTNPPALLLLRTHDDVKRTAAVLRMEESGPATPVSPLCARTHRGPSHDQFTEHDPGVCRRVWVDRKSAILPYGWSVYTTLLLTSRFTTNRMWREPWREPNASPPPVSPAKAISNIRPLDQELLLPARPACTEQLSLQLESGT